MTGIIVGSKIDRSSQLSGAGTDGSAVTPTVAHVPWPVSTMRSSSSSRPMARPSESSCTVIRSLPGAMSKNAAGLTVTPSTVALCTRQVPSMFVSCPVVGTISAMRTVKSRPPRLISMVATRRWLVLSLIVVRTPSNSMYPTPSSVIHVPLLTSTDVPETNASRTAVPS